MMPKFAQADEPWHQFDALSAPCSGQLLPDTGLSRSHMIIAPCFTDLSRSSYNDNPAYDTNLARFSLPVTQNASTYLVWPTLFWLNKHLA